MNTLHWLPIWERIIFKICMYVFKCLQGSAPEYLTDFLSRKLKPASGPLTRSSADTSLLIAHAGKICIGDKSFYVFAPSLWNSLPRNIREACALSSFKKVLKSHLYPSYWLCFAVILLYYVFRGALIMFGKAPNKCCYVCYASMYV